MEATEGMDMQRKIILGTLMAGVMFALAACGADPVTRGVTGGLLGARQRVPRSAPARARSAAC
jgi:hypothetical protein